MSRYFNDEGEPLMTAAQARFEDYLDMDSDAGDPYDDDYENRYYDEPAEDDDEDDEDEDE